MGRRIAVPACHADQAPLAVADRPEVAAMWQRAPFGDAQTLLPVSFVSWATPGVRFRELDIPEGHMARVTTGGWSEYGRVDKTEWISHKLGQTAAGVALDAPGPAYTGVPAKAVELFLAALQVGWIARMSWQLSCGHDNAGHPYVTVEAGCRFEQLPSPQARGLVVQVCLTWHSASSGTYRFSAGTSGCETPERPAHHPVSLAGARSLLDRYPASPARGVAA